LNIRLDVQESQLQMILVSPPLAAELPVTAMMNRMRRMLKTVRPATDAEALRRRAAVGSTCRKARGPA
jgi:hypothetical protein